MTDEVLLVVGDTELRKLIRLQLEHAEYNVTTAENGERCLSALSEANSLPNAVLIDEVLPRKDGVSIAQVLEDQYGDELSVLIMCLPDETRSGDSTAIGIEKPVDLARLPNRVEREV